jgi:hypothetical protein
MSKWFYEEVDGDAISYKFINSINDFPKDTFGFIYIITNNQTGKFYVGKKFLYHNKKKKLTKKELIEQTGPGRKPTFKVVQEESDWETYWGSSKELREDIKNIGVDKFTRQVLYFARNKKELTYYEVKYQILEDVLVSPLSYNDNVLGKFYKRDFVF